MNWDLGPKAQPTFAPTVPKGVGAAGVKHPVHCFGIFCMVFSYKRYLVSKVLLIVERGYEL